MNAKTQEFYPLFCYKGTLTEPTLHLMNYIYSLKSLKILLLSITLLSLGSALFPDSLSLLGLSKRGIENSFYWQWITYGLFEPSYTGITFSLLIQLGFSLYLLWIFGGSVLERLGLARFASLFFGSLLAGGLSASALMEGLDLPQFIASTTPAVYAILLAWTLLNSNTKVFIFFTFPIHARGAFYVLTGITLLSDLSNQNWPGMVALSAAMAYSYLFIRLSHFFTSSLFPSRKFEWTLTQWKNHLKKWTKKSPESYRSSKIYDIRSGKPILNDEQFMDAMLTRISLYGEETISPEDRKRMELISKRKKKK